MTRFPEAVLSPQTPLKKKKRLAEEILGRFFLLSFCGTLVLCKGMQVVTAGNDGLPIALAEKVQYKTKQFARSTSTTSQAKNEQQKQKWSEWKTKPT